MQWDTLRICADLRNPAGHSTDQSLLQLSWNRFSLQVPLNLPYPNWEPGDAIPFHWLGTWQSTRVLHLFLALPAFFGKPVCRPICNFWKQPKLLLSTIKQLFTTGKRISLEYFNSLNTKQIKSFADLLEDCQSNTYRTHHENTVGANNAQMLPWEMLQRTKGLHDDSAYIQTPWRMLRMYTHKGK